MGKRQPVRGSRQEDEIACLQEREHNPAMEPGAPPFRARYFHDRRMLSILGPSLSAPLAER